MPLLVCVRADWYRRHHKAKPLLMKQLSGKMRLLSNTMWRLFFFFFSHLGAPHSKHDEKAQTRLWQLWDSSITHTLLPSFEARAQELWRAFKGFCRCCIQSFSFSRKLEFSLHIVPVSPGQLLALIWMCLWRRKSHDRRPTAWVFQGVFSELLKCYDSAKLKSELRKDTSATCPNPQMGNFNIVLW